MIIEWPTMKNFQESMTNEVQNFVQTLVVILIFSTNVRRCHRRKHKALFPNAPNEGLATVPWSNLKKSSQETFEASFTSTCAVRKSSAPQETISSSAQLERGDELNEAFGEGALALSRVAEDIDESQASSMDLNLLLLSGDSFFSLRAQKSWTGKQLFSAALMQTRPALFPRSLICSKGVIQDHQTLESLGLTTGDSLHVIVSSLISRYYGIAEAGSNFDLEDTFKVEYIFSIAENFRFDLVLRVGGEYVFTFHGKLASGGRFVFDSSEVHVSVRLWLDDTGSVRLSDTGRWRFPRWQSQIVAYDGVKDLQLKPQG